MKYQFGESLISLKVILFLILMFNCQIGWTAPGDLDNSFGTNGIVITDLPPNSTSDRAEAIALQPDGKILVAGTNNYDKFAIARFAGNGSLDVDFGTNGVTITPIAVSGMAADMVLQPDGKILVAGVGNGGDFIVVRYLADGSLDPVFDADGIVTVPFAGAAASAKGIALQSDGKILVSGGVILPGPDVQVALARLDQTGKLDAGFDGDGRLTTDVGYIVDRQQVVAVQPDGKIIVTVNAASDISLVRYLPDGSLDTGFGLNGVASTPIGTLDDYIYSIALQPDGKIVVAGNAIEGVNSRGFAIVRFYADGSLDTSFGSNGRVIESLASLGAEGANALVVQPDGKLVIAGEYVSRQTPNDLDISVIRFNENGTLDNTFGTGGIFTLDLGTILDFGLGLAIQPDGKLIVSGERDGDFLILRLDGSSFDVTPDTFSFTDETEVNQDQLQTSNLITVTGLTAGVEVPVSVSGGEYAIDGSTSYTNFVNWVANNDQISVRHTSSSSVNSTVNTVLTVGGVMAPNSITHLGTDEIVKDTFSTTTPVFTLVSPLDGANNLNTSVTFVWKIPAYPNGGVLSYQLFLCEDQGFVGCVPTIVAMVETVKDLASIDGLLPLALFGTIFGGMGLKKRKWIRIGLLSSIYLLGVIGIAACGGGGGGGGSSGGGGSPPTEEKSYTVPGLKPATTYYWKVDASDGIDTVTSETRSFTTL